MTSSTATKTPKRKRGRPRSEAPTAAEYLTTQRGRGDRRRALTLVGQDIGPIPPVENPRRRARAIKSFPYFCRTHLKAAFFLPWADYHKRAAATIQTAVLFGGLFAFAMPRGSGKTTLSEAAAIWAAICGHSLYSTIIGPSETAGEQRLRNIKTSLSTNDLLLADFPEVIYPIRCLENSSRRAEGQRQAGARTAIAWQTRRIVLPTILDATGKPYPASGAVITAYGLTGELRGLNHQLQDGTVVRPQLAVCDDPQTRESARSPSQSHYRERVLAGDIAYLAGPTKPIAVVMPCTVIYPDDMADRMLDREKHPEWQGHRTQMVDSFPDDLELWDQYADIQRHALRTEQGPGQANAFYKKHRRKMDAGAKVTWKHRHLPTELSAVQHAMNLKIRDEAAFWAEAQNQPQREEADLAILTAPEIATKVSGFPRRQFPTPCDRLTAFVDVQGKLLYWLVAAWEHGFTGYILDYGSWPPQKRSYYTLADARQTLKRRYPGTDDEAAIFAGIQELVATLAGHDYRRDDGATLRLSRLMVDANWGGTSALVNSALRQSPHAGILSPSYGRGIKASGAPISQWQQSRGKPYGPEWVPTKAKGRHLVGIVYDTNYWKKRFHDALALPLGTRAAVHLYHHKNAAQHHQMIADHLAAEVPKKTAHGKRTVYEWSAKPGQDNHLLDCAVGAMVAASVAGISNTAAKPSPARPRKRVKYL